MFKSGVVHAFRACGCSGRRNIRSSAYFRQLTFNYCWDKREYSSFHLPLLQNAVLCFPSARYFSSGSLPAHEKVALPALSPTMQKGTILNWVKQEGDSVAEGDLLCEIETDKATMSVEATDEGYLAKILIQAGERDVPIGKLMCIVVQEQADVSAFKDFVDDGSTVDSSKSNVPSSPAPAPAPAPAPSTSSTASASSSDTSKYPSHFIVTLPALSPTMEQGKVRAWLKSEGDELKEGDVLAQIETDKTTMDMETPEEGFLAKIFVPADSESIPLQAPLCLIVESKEDVGKFKDFVPSLPGSTAKESIPSPAAPAAPVASAPTSANLQVKQPPTGKVAASPMARRLALEKGFNLSDVAGSGPGGRVRAADVDKFVPGAVATDFSASSFQDIPLSSMRKVIAQRLVHSKQTVPHYYLSVDSDVSKLLKLRTDFNKSLSKENVKLSVNDFVIKASSLACLKVPEVNSSWMDTFIRQFARVDVSVAVATDRGLITPIIFDADKKGLVAIHANVNDLAAKARDGKLRPNEFQGGTFTISNLGMFGVRNFSAIINPPQACILAVGAGRRELVVDDSNSNGYSAATVMSVTLSCDHRVVDGAVGAQWLAEFKHLLEHPHFMLL